MITNKTAIIRYILITLATLSLAVSEKRFVSPIFDFECKN